MVLKIFETKHNFLHSIPLDGEKRQKWLDFVHEIQGSDNNSSKLTQRITLCSIHFGTDAFTKDGNLFSNSSPTISACEW